MTRIREVEINNFRGIKKLIWHPSNGINCLIGCGDSGKSSVLDAIDLCIGARKNWSICDADFYQLDIENSIKISVTIGGLSDSLKNIDKYGYYLRGFDSKTSKIEDEPDNNKLEDVLTVIVIVNEDLEPTWSLFSERTSDNDFNRYLTWSDRMSLSPTRIGNTSDYNLSWKKGSILNKISEEKINSDTSVELAAAVRNARRNFIIDSNKLSNKLLQGLIIIQNTTEELGIKTGGSVKPLLDVDSINLNAGVVALHDSNNIPLKNLGTGSTRLLIAGLQKKAAQSSSVILIDELEYGLEPHRIIRLLSSLGAKEKNDPLQVFMTTHSPTALKELSANQLYILKEEEKEHKCVLVASQENTQATIRSNPEAYLASAILVCEGSSEVGFIRGIDQHRTEVDKLTSIHALGVALVDADGSQNILKKALPMLKLGYKVAILKDNDQEKLKKEDEANFIKLGGKVFTWQDNFALEDQIFHDICNNSVEQVLNYLKNNSINVDENIKSALNGKYDLKQHMELLSSPDGGDRGVARKYLAKAAKAKANSWFKSISRMEEVTYSIIAPNLSNAEPYLRKKIEEIFEWSKCE